MASKIILHIGLQKSGTTFLQHMLYDNREALDAAGVRYPVPLDWDRRRRSVPNHEWSTYGLLGTEYPWVTEQRAAEEGASWKVLLDQVKAWPDTVLLSAEALSTVRAPAAGRLLDGLGCDDVEVVITARSLGRALPSMWQQHIRNGRFIRFGGFLGGLAEQRDKGWEHVENDLDVHVWRAFVLNGLVWRWSEVGAKRVSLVTTPGRPPQLLWGRFADVIGLPDLAKVAPTREWDRAHTGLTAPETLVMASLNRLLRDNHWTSREMIRVREIVTERFQTREGRGGKIVIPSEWRARVAEWSSEDLDALAELDVRIVGDLGDLAYDPEGEGDPEPTVEETGQAGAEAIYAVAEAGLRESTMRRRARRVRRILR